jgi:hypothetical protein
MADLGARPDPVGDRDGDDPSRFDLVAERPEAFFGLLRVRGDELEKPPVALGGDTQGAQIDARVSHGPEDAA